MPAVLNKYKDKIDRDKSVYIGRGSKWGNPFPMKNSSQEERDRVCDEFDKYLQIRQDLLEDAKTELKGKDLVCFCNPKRCHGFTLFKVANE